MCVVVVFVPPPFATYGYSYFFYTVCIIGWCVRRFGILIVTRKFWFYKQSVRGRVYCVETRVHQRLIASEQRDSAVVSILNY